jgi:hypothetical protein
MPPTAGNTPFFEKPKSTNGKPKKKPIRSPSELWRRSPANITVALSRSERTVDDEEAASVGGLL